MVFDMNYSREDYNVTAAPASAAHNNGNNNDSYEMHNNYLINNTTEGNNSKDLFNFHNTNYNNTAPSLPSSSNIFNLDLINNNRYPTNNNSYYSNSTLDPIIHNNYNPVSGNIINNRRSSSINAFPINSLNSPINNSHQGPQHTGYQNSNLRFESVLEAPTAAAQRIDECSLTYLNKSQLYGITINDHEKYDGDLQSSIRITFYDESHRRMAGTYWSFWLSQQPNPKIAKSIQLDKTASSNITNCDDSTKSFDSVQFKWNGLKGCKIYVKFNCLSTDFSRVKGVKGIPLKVQIITKAVDSPTFIESCFCKIKLFRDKGAERKNKDDQRHLDKVWDKMKGKHTNNDNNSPLLMMFAPVSPVTVFTETKVITPTTTLNGTQQMESQYLYDIEEENTKLEIDRMMQSGQIRNKKFDSKLGEFPDLLDVDPNYIPHQIKRKKVLCVYIKIYNENMYRAIYLDELNLNDLVKKICAKLQVPFESVVNVYRINKKGNGVALDDGTVQQLEDEQDMLVECDFQNNESSSLNLTLKF